MRHPAFRLGPRCSTRQRHLWVGGPRGQRRPADHAPVSAEHDVGVTQPRWGVMAHGRRARRWGGRDCGRLDDPGAHLGRPGSRRAGASVRPWRRPGKVRAARRSLRNRELDRMAAPWAARWLLNPTEHVHQQSTNLRKLVNTRRNVARFSALSVASVATTLCFATSASAHVTVDPSTTAAGSYTVLTIAVPHGCEESSTTKVAIKIPEPILSVTPTRDPFWDVESHHREARRAGEGCARQCRDRARGDGGVHRQDAAPARPAGRLRALAAAPGRGWDDPDLPDRPDVRRRRNGLGGGALRRRQRRRPRAPGTGGHHHRSGRDGSRGTRQMPTKRTSDADSTSAAKPDRTGLLGLLFGVAGLALGATALVQVRRRK